MAEKKVVRYKLVRHKWPDEIQAEKNADKEEPGLSLHALYAFFGGSFFKLYAASDFGSPQ